MNMGIAGTLLVVICTAISCLIVNGIEYLIKKMNNMFDIDWMGMIDEIVDDFDKLKETLSQE